MSGELSIVLEPDWPLEQRLRVLPMADMEGSAEARELVVDALKRAADELDRYQAAIEKHRKWVEHLHRLEPPLPRVNPPGMPWDRELWEALDD